MHAYIMKDSVALRSLNVVDIQVPFVYRNISDGNTVSRVEEAGSGVVSLLYKETSIQCLTGRLDDWTNGFKFQPGTISGPALAC
jgi:hypothetical protein